MENEKHAFVKTRIYAVIFASLVLCLSCCETTPNESRILSKEKMVQLMGEVYLVEMYYQKGYGTPSLYKLHLDSALTKVFKKHRVSRREYEKSFTHYASTPSEFTEMNEQIIQQYNETLVQK